MPTCITTEDCGFGPETCRVGRTGADHEGTWKGKEGGSTSCLAGLSVCVGGPNAAVGIWARRACEDTGFVADDGIDVCGEVEKAGNDQEESSFCAGHIVVWYLSAASRGVVSVVYLSPY
jgi:hypothetical protein